MAKRLMCQHVDGETQCNYIAEAETVDAVLEKVIGHATKIHKAPHVIFENKEQIEKMIAAIREPPEDTYPQTLKHLETFMNSALLLKNSADIEDLKYYNRELLRVASVMPNSTIEGGALEKLHAAMGNSTLKDIADSFALSISDISRHVAISLRKVIAVFDYTEESYQGTPDNAFIHEWNGQSGTETAFKFLTCSVFNDSLMFPMFSIPAQVGNNTVKDIGYLIEELQKKKNIGNIVFSVYGKELYSAEVLGKLKEMNKPYIILVPESHDIREEFSFKEEDKEIHLEKLFCFADEKNGERNNFYSGFLKSVFGSEANDYGSWCFVENIEDSELNAIVSKYTQGWQIWDRERSREYSYIKTDSQDTRVQYLVFSYCLLLRAHWVVYYMEEDISFEDYLKRLQELSSK